MATRIPTPANGVKKALGWLASLMVVSLVVYSLVTVYKNVQVEKMQRAVAHSQRTASTSASTSAGINSRNMEFSSEIPTASLDRLKVLYAVYLTDGSSDSRLRAAMGSNGATSQDLFEAEEFRARCNFNRKPGGRIAHQVITSSRLSSPFTIGGNYWESCSKSTARVLCRVYDMKPNSRRCSAGVIRSNGTNLIQYQIDSSDPNPNIPEDYFIKIWPKRR